MQRAVRIALAVILGFIAGSAVNMALIMVSGKVIAPPAGADVTTTEGLKATMHLFQPRHFIFPFLAHALGTFAGAFVATLLAPLRSATPALLVGVLFLAGGIASVFMLPSPAWFDILDLVLAYLPFAWLAHRIAARMGRHARSSRAAG